MVKDGRIDWKTELFYQILMLTSKIMVLKMSEVVLILIKTTKNQLPFGQIDGGIIISKNLEESAY